MLSQSNIQNYEWLSQAVIHKLFTMAIKEFQEETYDITRIARQMILFLQQEKGLQTKYNRPSSNTSQQIISFCSLLGSTPKYFIQLLNQELITSNSYIVTINNLNEEITRRFFDDFKSQNCKVQSLPNYFSNEQLSQDLYVYVNVVAKKFCKVYDQCSKLLKKDISSLTDKIKSSKIMNNFMLYKIFREISVSSKKMVQEKCLQTVFRNCPYEVIQQFQHYLINKFEIVKLVVNQEITNSSMFQPSPLIFFSKFQNNQQIQLSPKEAVNSDGKFAIFIKTYSENPQIQNELEDYMLVLDSKSNLKFINCKTLRKRWYILNDIKMHVALTMMARQFIIDGQFSIDNLLKSKNGPIQTLAQCQPLEAFTNYNGIIGRSLYLMKQYSGVSAFFKDLSKRAILTRSIEQIMCQIPILGYMIFAGTFSSNFYFIFSNKFSTDQKKFKQFGEFMLSTTTTVGTSILGAITGQMLIPIPFVGALIGSVIGGFIGEKGGKHINSWIEKKKFGQTIKYLKNSQVNQQHWECTPQFYKALQIKQAQFQKYIPSYTQDHVFATLIAFVLICFYQSKRLNTFNLQKTKKQNKQKTKDQKKRQRQFQEQIKKMALQEQFQTQFNIMKIVQYLQNNNGYLYQHFETMQKSILTNLAKIIS